MYLRTFQTEVVDVYLFMFFELIKAYSELFNGNDIHDYIIFVPIGLFW